MQLCPLPSLSSSSILEFDRHWCDARAPPRCDHGRDLATGISEFAQDGIQGGRVAESVGVLQFRRGVPLVHKHEGPGGAIGKLGTDDEFLFPFFNSYFPFGYVNFIGL